jgi:hypothetical protein
VPLTRGTCLLPLPSAPSSLHVRLVGRPPPSLRVTLVCGVRRKYGRARCSRESESAGRCEKTIRQALAAAGASRAPRRVPVKGRTGMGADGQYDSPRLARRRPPPGRLWTAIRFRLARTLRCPGARARTAGASCRRADRRAGARPRAGALTPARAQLPHRTTMERRRELPLGRAVRLLTASLCGLTLSADRGPSPGSAALRLGLGAGRPIAIVASPRLHTASHNARAVAGAASPDGQSTWQRWAGGAARSAPCIAPAPLRARHPRVSGASRPRKRLAGPPSRQAGTPLWRVHATRCTRSARAPGCGSGAMTARGVPQRRPRCACH